MRPKPAGAAPWLRRALGPDGWPFESAEEALAALDDTTRGLLEAWPGSLLPASPLVVRKGQDQVAAAPAALAGFAAAAQA